MTNEKSKMTNGKCPYRLISPQRLNLLGLFWLLALLLSARIVYGQESGVISGRVVAEGGKPLSDWNVHLSSSGGDRSRGISRSTTTDADGNFRFKNLPERSYSLSVSLQRGYILAGSNKLSGYRPGEIATITMTRGGVITGRVTDPNGEPVVGVTISMLRVRDQEDRKLQAFFPGIPRVTDDRGVYRVYGLQPGSYVVVANGGQSFSGPGLSPYHGEAPTYHPSSGRADAAEIKVTSGSEVTGVDIRYRAETGRTVSGKVSGADQTLLNGSVNLSLRDAATGVIAAYAQVQKSGGQSGFVMQGVPNGEYELTAVYGGSDSDEFFVSEPRRVTVNGADVGNLDLPLISMAIVYGRVAWEKSQTVCDPKRKLSFDEISVFAQRDDSGSAKPASPWSPSFGNGVMGENGEFKVTRLTPGRHRLMAALQLETGFVKSISGPVLTLSSRGVPVRSGVTAELSHSGLALRTAERYSDLLVSISDGGASLEGKVTAKENASLPSRLQVHLIPVEAAAANNLLRYAERRAGKSGEFAFNNLAPGKYWLLTRALPDTNEIERQPTPLAWDAAERAKLRKDAEAAKHEVELKPCQRVKDHVLPF